MARKADVLCGGGCGRLLWRGTGSAEHPMCQPCRRKRNPPVPCTGCGKLMVTKAGSALAGERLCGECRRPVLRSCEACGQMFLPYRPDRRACCRVPCGRAVQEGLSLAEYEEHAAWSRAGRSWAAVCKVWYANCAECGVLFIARLSAQVRCSDECRRKYGSRVTSESIMARYRADPAFRAKVMSSAQNRRADKLGLPGITRPANLVAFLYERFGGICQLCQEPVTELAGRMQPSPDHIIPLSRCEELGIPKDRRHVIENLWLAHLKCNLAKNDKLPDPGIVETVMAAIGLR